MITQARMREIRWEEALLNRRQKAEGQTRLDYTVVHITCHCGSEGCRGIPYARPIEPSLGVEVEAPREAVFNTFEEAMASRGYL